MIKLNNKYVIGTHVMFFEIEMYKDFIDGLVNLLQDVSNKNNVTIDLCFNLTENVEKIEACLTNHYLENREFLIEVTYIQDLMRI